MGWAILVLGAGGCSPSGGPPDGKLWTLFDVQALLEGGAAPSYPLAPDAGLPGGKTLATILDGSTLAARSGWSDGYSVSYLTTEVWANYAQVWMQPAYVPVTGWSNGAPQVLQGGGASHPIFSVGPGSGFYSPFWQIVYVDVPADTPAGALTSARQILDAGYSLTPSEGRTMPLVPNGISGGGTPGTGWLDGAPISFVDFGTDTFTWDSSNVVAETPLYIFTVAGADGQPHTLPGIPSVLGTAPPGAVAAPAPRIDGQPRYVAYWRLYATPVPSFATIFAPPGTALATQLAGIGAASAAPYAPAITADDPANLAPYVGRVATDPIDPATGQPDCFADQASLDSCRWILSQTDLEGMTDWSTSQPTGITVTCPVVSWSSLPVTPL